MRLIGYGGMLTESFVGDHGVDHRCGPQPAPVLRHQRARRPDRRHRGDCGDVRQRARSVRSPVDAADINGWAQEVGEKSIVSRTGGAPTLAIGMSEVLSVFGGHSLRPFWYHFAIVFEAVFILTTVDAGTRVARFMLSDGLSNVGGPLRKLKDPSWRVGAWLCSLLVVAAWGSILLMGVTDPLGGINTLFPLFGIANQLLAAIALTVVSVVVIKKGLLKWVWIPGIPLLWDLTVTLTASWQKIFSGRPQARLLETAQRLRGRTGSRQALPDGEDTRRRRQDRPQHLHSGLAVDRVRGAGGRRFRGRSDRGAAGDTRRRKPADRG